MKEHDFELILQFYKDLIARKTSRPLEEEMEFLLEMYCRGSVYMTEKWVLGGMKDSPRRMSDKLVEAIDIVPFGYADTLRGQAETEENEAYE